MNKKDISMNHPVSAAAKRLPKTQQVLEDSKAIFEKVEEIKEAAEQKAVESITKATNTPAMRNLKELLFFGALSKKVELNGFTFELKTLTNAQSRQVSRRWVALDEHEQASKGNLLLVAASLYSINNSSVADVYENLFEVEAIDDTLEMAIEILSNLNTHLVGLLVKEYLELSERSAKMLTLHDEGKETESAENLK